MTPEPTRFVLDLTLSMCRVTGRLPVLTRPEVVILGADRKERGLWHGEENDSNQDHQLLSCGFPVTSPSVKFAKTCIIPECEVILSKFDSVLNNMPCLLLKTY